ncbi:hypothetical protein I4U23_001490 [Adineta vaga]|nr:hypothetical protein I4U23_001490 [Adineta vaga]
MNIRHYLLNLCFLLLPLHVALHYNDKGSYNPSFERQTIDDDIQDGYWIEAFQSNNHTPIGFIAYGLRHGEIKLYPNPSATIGNIEPIHIQKLLSPVAIDQADITGNGLKDIIICFDYGNTMTDFNPNGGHIVWLENPGQNVSKEHWKQHYVGKSPTMHRLKIGHFTQNERWEVIGLPLVNGPFDVPVPVLLFRQPDNVLNATVWKREIINKDYFHIIHDAKKFHTNSLDSLLIASREGLNWLSYHPKSSKWIIEHISDGEQEDKQQTNFYGSGGVDIGKIGNDSFAYIAALEPFHGNVVAVYIKNINNSLTQIRWERYILDIYGYPNQNGEGPSHYIVCADLDNDGDDEFLVALRGPAPNEGVYYYKAIDLSRGLFAKWKVSDQSAARIAIADFDYDGLLDFATISYYVPGYHMAEDSSLNIFYNRFNRKKLENRKQLQVTKEHDELVVTVPRPNQAIQYQVLPFLKIGNITLSLEILPPNSSRQINKNTYIKVLWGILSWTNSSTKYARQFLCEPKSICSLKIQSDDDKIKTNDEGAVFIVLQMPDGISDIPQFDNIQKIITENILPEQYSNEARQFDFKFVRVDQLEWGKENFQDLEFYNLKGVNINFDDNNEHLCHIQLWAAGKGVNAGVHNHATDRFCEVHACIINGNKKSGMQYLEDSNESYDPLTTSDSKFIQLDVPSLYEHGPLWDIDKHKQPVLRENGTVVYPWHKWQSAAQSHVMLSYQWNSQAIVPAVYRCLRPHDIPLWIDTQGEMKGHLSISVTESVENAAVICCFLTPKVSR